MTQYADSSRQGVTYQQIQAFVVENLQSLALIAGIVAVFAIFEYFWAAGRAGGAKHRAYNLLVFALNSLGMAAAGLILNRLEALMPKQGLLAGLYPKFADAGWLGVIYGTVVYVVIYDFFHYWTHRAQHEFAPLWMLHRVHHNDDAMDASTSVRHSLGAGITGTILAHFPTYYICGGGLLPFAGAVVLFWFWFFFSHANIRVHLGKLGYLLVGPQWHRLHHGRFKEYHNRNYAQFFPVYDWLFGTLRMPTRSEWPETGVDGDDAPKPAWQQVFMPWRKALNNASTLGAQASKQLLTSPTEELRIK
jgi:sterol desaturase/sphingolipid hydroxylase (fatty acid hydroxylase superfamily)